ncbi:hypothetical protein PVAND_010290 [Polypedilum vanderplanki]|uniref:Zinc finger CCCH domain-containing protein 14 n=1 Tax=Polypedilum vanderplanki TaxID=319348 RepID=A0A9J6CFU2_POLVA|nr:hypothetical protein PVAND_010290 [Polypedilum vanderplanki]
MDSLGEVGKKMRSAIKAKLVELGNASQTGYIDDELPDYVMIMVANKRSKQQMLTDLNLFLGSNTESFVNWLHQVLQKLQEVTLPSSLASKAKKKSNDSSSKKDKKKDKKKIGKEPSITDVIAVELMEKAKKTIDPKVKSEDEYDSNRTPSPSINPPEAPKITSSSSKDKNNDDEFNIPTITEITSANNRSLHKKELMQLEEIQNRIYEQKKKLKSMADDEDDPMISDKEKNDNSEDHRNKIKSQDTQNNKISIKSRLGTKPVDNPKPSTIISLSAIRKTENELFAPTASFRKLIEKQKEENERRDDRRLVRNRTDPYNRHRRDKRSRSRSLDRYNRNRDKGRRRSRSRSRSPLRRSQERKSRPSIRQRIGSRAYSPKQHHRSKSKSPDNFKVKQRPALSSAITANAGKNLLLRAMAEAKRSTSSSTDLRKRNREQIVVQVRNEKRNMTADEEYVPESISGHSESEAEYHPSFKKEPLESMEDDDVIVYNDGSVDIDDLDDNNETTNRSPKFFVTFNKDASEKYDQNSQSSHSPTPPPVIKDRRKSIKERIGVKSNDKYNNHEINSKFEDSRKRKIHEENQDKEEEEESESQRAYNKHDKKSPAKNNNGKSDLNGEEHKRIRLETTRSFDHVPSLLSSVAVPVAESIKPVIKSKERCKFYPACSNANCLFYHPTLPCKLFPNCKFGDSCAYVHPKCKFDVTCNRIDCNFTHTPIAAASNPIIASSVVPAQNYKSITITPNSTVCKFFPNCTNTNCIYQHPKICKFGKSCANKFDCNFYHFELSGKSKFKWISPLS